MRWLPLLDTMVRMAKFKNDHLALKSLVVDYPDQGKTFKQLNDEYIGTPREVRDWPDSQSIDSHDGGIQLEEHWMNQKMWLRSALATPGRVPTLQKKMYMGDFRPITWILPSTGMALNL
jgi:hypothetical protein